MKRFTNYFIGASFLLTVIGCSGSDSNKTYSRPEANDSTIQEVVEQDSVANDSDSMAVTQTEEVQIAAVPINDKAAQNLIKRLYENYVFGSKDINPFVPNFSHKLRQKLRDAYDDDTEGYGIWLFRNSMIDSAPVTHRSKSTDEEDAGEETSLVAITKIDSIPGSYKVEYMDMGSPGECIISLIMENGKLLIDDVQ